jgi:hypothetical protein
MECSAIDFGKNYNRFDTHFSAGANDAHRDFSTVGYEDAFKHGLLLRSRNQQHLTIKLQTEPLPNCFEAEKEEALLTKGFP